MSKRKPNEFLKALRSTSKSTKRPEAMTVITEFCSAVSEYTKDKVRCFPDPGYRVNMGQEWRVTIQSAASATSYVLLRAYVPQGDDGFPVTLDIYEDELVPCPDAQALRKQLAAFLQKPTVLETIDLLAQQPR